MTTRLMDGTGCPACDGPLTTPTRCDCCGWNESLDLVLDSLDSGELSYVIQQAKRMRPLRLAEEGAARRREIDAARAAMLDSTADHDAARRVLDAAGGPPPLPERCPDCDEVHCVCGVVESSHDYLEVGE